MSEVLIVIHLLIVLAMIGVILLQRSEGGALGMGGGTGGFLTSRGKANVLTRATAILAAIFFVTSLTLAILAAPRGGPRSVFDVLPSGGEPQAPGQAPQGGILDQLKGMQPRQAPAPAPAPSQPQAPVSK